MKDARIYVECPKCEFLKELILPDFDFEYNDEYPEENGIFVTGAEINTKCDCGHFIKMKVKESLNVE
jgi:hypothetical protein